MHLISEYLGNSGGKKRMKGFNDQEHTTNVGDTLKSDMM